MVPQTITYDGRLRCTARHEPSGATLVTDAPKDNQGEGASFSPTDLLCTALATCMTTTMAIVARRHGFELGPVRAAVEKHMTAQPPRTIARVVVGLAMPAGLTAEQRTLMEQAAHGCPVALALKPTVEQAVRFTYP
jgi:putative redox protein